MSVVFSGWKFRKKIALLIALLSVALMYAFPIHAAGMKPFRCQAKVTVGADADKGFQPTSFSSTREYRLLPAEAALQQVTDDSTWMEGAAKAAQENKGVAAFIRNVTEDPTMSSSWTFCEVELHRPSSKEEAWPGGLVRRSHPAFQTVHCEGVDIEDFKMNTYTLKYRRIAPGDFERRDDMGEHIFLSGLTKQDPYFEFGLCTPYFD